MTITLENGKQVVITAKNAGEKNIYVQSCRFNGKPFNNCWFRHSDIENGATIEFVMGDQICDGRSAILVGGERGVASVHVGRETLKED